ncbi:MAG: MarR family transcriptional regulator [Roseococcus sp.]|nr:MarR family transcriptional regulator [Roseococcus sp.]
MSEILESVSPAERPARIARVTPARPDYCLDSSAGHLLRLAHQRYQAMFQEHAMGLGLTGPQFATLLRLSQLGRATQNHLGRLAGMDSATIQGVVRRLIARGFMRTANDPLDRRMRVLTMTPEGEAVVRDGQQAGTQANDALMSGLSERERAQLISLLRRLSPG